MNIPNVMYLCPFLAASRPSWRTDLVCASAIIAALTGQVSNVQAAEFLAANNATVSGEIIRFTDSTITIRPNIGSMIIVARGDIRWVRYALNDGGTIEGRLHGWRDGVYVIDVGEGLVSVRDGTVDSEPVRAKPASPVDQKKLEAANTVPDDSSAPTEIAGADVIEIDTDVDVTSEAASVLIFDISLSKQTEDQIVLHYETVDGTAEAGKDYEARSGEFVLPAGTTSTRLRLAAKLIDDDEVEEDETMTLFLSTAPTAATIFQKHIFQKHISATIRDDDR